jgi:hypothetical protein
MAQSFDQAFAQFRYGGRLVAGGLEVRNEPEVGHINLVSLESEYTAGRAYRTPVLVWFRAVRHLASRTQAASTNSGRATC